MITGVTRHNSSKLGSALASTVIHYAQTTLLFNVNHFIKSISAHRNIAFLSIKILISNFFFKGYKYNT